MGAKTLSGFGYRGHIFWDNEIFVLPFFTYTQPQIACNMLRYRYNSLPGARRKAITNGYAGAQFPWESAETGEEVTPTWVPHFADPTQLVRIWTGDIQIHISADIAYAMHQFWQVTGDDDFWRQVGIPVLLETAVFWGERAELDGEHFSIRDVIGPDENHDHVDNNQFTNYMVRWHLRTALQALDWLNFHDPDLQGVLISKLDLSPERLAGWARVIDGLILLHDTETGLIEQFEGFYDLKDADWPAFAGRTQSMQELLGIEGCTEYKALKQADVIALLCLLGDQFPEFNEQTWRANWEYYVPITDHEYGSSLGPSMHAWAACRMGLPEEAYTHFMRAARADLLDVRGNAGDGIHAASAGGLWEAVVFGFAGLRLTENGLSFSPRFPAHWQRVAFNILYRGEQLRFDFRP
jgi:kojibiose phosphorylase